MGKEAEEQLLQSSEILAAKKEFLQKQVVPLLDNYLERKRERKEPTRVDEFFIERDSSVFDEAMQVLEEIIKYLREEGEWRGEWLNLNPDRKGFLAEAMAYVILSLICGEENVEIIPYYQERFYGQSGDLRISPLYLSVCVKAFTPSDKGVFFLEENKAYFRMEEFWLSNFTLDPLGILWKLSQIAARGGVRERLEELERFAASKRREEIEAELERMTENSQYIEQLKKFRSDHFSGVNYSSMRNQMRDFYARGRSGGRYRIPRKIERQIEYALRGSIFDIRDPADPERPNIITMVVEARNVVKRILGKLFPRLSPDNIWHSPIIQEDEYKSASASKRLIHAFVNLRAGLG